MASSGPGWLCVLHVSDACVYLAQLARGPSAGEGGTSPAVAQGGLWIPSPALRPEGEEFPPEQPVAPNRAAPAVPLCRAIFLGDASRGLTGDAGGGRGRSWPLAGGSRSRGAAAGLGSIAPTFPGAHGVPWHSRGCFLGVWCLKAAFLLQTHLFFPRGYAL